MLVELRVKDFAIIDQIQLEFGAGLNIISGETGAGKSVIVRSLSLLMGAKSQSDDLRKGARQAIVEGNFEIHDRPDIIESLQEFGISHEDSELVVRRIMAKDGKNRVYINGHLSTLTDLKNIIAPLVEVTGKATPLIEMTGQHDNKNLLSAAYHLDMLDQFCQSWDLRAKIHQFITQIREIDEQIESLKSSSMDRSQRLDFIKYQIDEIESLSLDFEKDQQIEQKIKSLRGQHYLSDFYLKAQDILDGDNVSVNSMLSRLLQEARSLKTSTEALDQVMDLIEDAQKLIQEASYQISTSTPDEDNEQELDELESRLSSIRKLQKKFGKDISDIQTAFEDMKKELYDLENTEEQIAQLNLKKKALQTEMQPILKKLTQTRQKGATQLAQNVNKQLSELNMKGVIFDIEIEALEKPNITGSDHVAFTIRNGAKGEPRPIHKTASGGELSRILLSLKVAIGNIDLPRSYLFDEVDTGVSGLTAEKVGKKLKGIAKGQQVICITHLPQVASFGDQHYFISKQDVKGSMVMKASPLTGKARVQEIARLISGEKINKTSLDHAQHLLNSSL